MANFAVTLVHGPEHAEFMDGLVADDVVLMGGPVGSGEQTLHVVDALDEAAIRRRLAEDPWARADMLEVGSIRPWAFWLDFRKGPG